MGRGLDDDGNLIVVTAVTRDCCKGATSEQGVRIVIKYIEARSKRMQEPFGELALEALGEAWPCER